MTQTVNSPSGSEVTLYRQGLDTQNMIGELVESLKPLSVLAEMAASQHATEEMIAQINNSVNEIVTSQDRLADKIIEIDAFIQSVNSRVASVDETSVQTLAAVKGIQATVDTFVGWFVPILDDFRDSAIIPTMARIEGKVNELHLSHESIKQIVQDGYDKVEPLMQRLEESPLIRMLGVK